MKSINKKNFLASISFLLSSAFACAFGVTKTNQNITSKAEQQNRIVLSGSNKLTEEEGGSWDNPKGAYNFTKQTDKGNDIVFHSNGGRSFTYISGESFAIMRNSDGWFCNETPLTGLYKVVLSCTRNRSIRLDFGSSCPLTTYSGSSTPDSNVTYSTDVLNGNGDYTIDLPSDQFFNYIRIQPVQADNNWLVRLELYYTCETPSHIHSYIHHDEVSPDEENDGIQEHYTCTGCDKVFDKNKNETTMDNLLIPHSTELINSKVLVVADLHVCDDTNNQNHLEKTLRYIRSNNIPVVIFNGDIVDTGIQEYYDIVDTIFERVFGDVAIEYRPEFLFNMGNHEFYPTSSCRHQETVYSTQFNLFKNFANKWSKVAITDNVYMRTIQGVNYIVAAPGPESMDGEYYLAALGGYSDQDFQDIAAYLQTAASNGQPIVLATHHPWGYTYGGTNYGMPSDSVVTRMRNLLANYPGLINFTSHTHFSNLHERALDQTNYTSVNVGMHCYGKYVSGYEFDENNDLITYQNISSRRITGDSQSSAQHGMTHFGIGVEFGEENISIKRVNLAKGRNYSHGSWTIPYGITQSNKHDKFYYETGERTGEELLFSGDNELIASVETNVSNAEISIEFEDVEKYWAVEGYKVEIKGSSKAVIYKTWWQSLFWADLERKSNYSFTLSGIKLDSEYTVSVYPMDFFGHYGTPLTKVLTTSAESTSEDEIEAASGDLLYTSTISATSFNAAPYKQDRKCTEVSTTDSGYSLKLSCDETGTGYPSITLELKESLNLINKQILMDAKFINAHKWFSIQLFNSSNVKVLGETGIDLSTESWSTATFDVATLQSKTIDGYDLSDVKYIKIVLNLKKKTGVNQTVYFDNLKVM